MKRRSFLKMSGVGVLSTGGLSGGGGARSSRVSLRTPLCERLGIDLPILQSGMGRVAGPELAAKVSSAGGLGILAGLGLPPSELQKQIRRVRELTDRPFGVNLWLHRDLQPPAGVETVDPGAIASVTATLDRFRAELGLPPRPPLSGGFPDLIDEAIEVILDERVPVWSIGLGDPGADRVSRCHQRGVAVMAMIATLEDAKKVAESGVDIVVAQGGEAGGHRSTWVKPDSPERANVGTLALVPQVVDGVGVPVVAAGGIADGRGLVAAMALGAQGIMLGTRFVATRESMAPDFYKRSILQASSDDTTVTDAFTGLYARALRNRFSEEYRATGAPVLPSLLQALAADDIYRAAAERGDPEFFPMPSGQSAGLIGDLRGADEVVSTIAAEASEALASLLARVSSDSPGG